MKDSYKPDYRINDRVRIKNVYPQGHHRTPWFIKGKIGLIAAIYGKFLNPEQRAYGLDGCPKQALYRIQFKQKNVWVNYLGETQDTLCVDLYERWIERV